MCVAHQKAVKMKYISMKMEPKGSTPEASTTNRGLLYQGCCGIGRGMLLTLQGGSYLPEETKTGERK
jgi:hypothetical protein